MVSNQFRWCPEPMISEPPAQSRSGSHPSAPARPEPAREAAQRAERSGRITRLEITLIVVGLLVAVALFALS
jgi:hypothetical protein